MAQPTISLDGTLLSTTVTNLRVLDIMRPLRGENRDVYVSVPGRVGDWLFADEPGDATITVRCATADGSWASCRAAARLAAAWARKSSRKKLIFSDESSYFYYAKLANAPEVQEGPNVAFFDLEFRCDPYAYATSTTTETWSASDNVAHTWTPSDTVPTPPIVQVQAGAGGITGGFTLTVNGDALVYPSTVAANGYVTVSTVGYVCTNVANTDTEIVGSYSAANVSMSGVTGDFGFIVSGQNSVTVNTADGSTTSVTVLWRRRYD